MATATLIETDPLQSIQWPGAPAANQPTKPTSSKPLFGKELGVGVPIPVDLSFPIAPQTVWENKFIRFKFGLDGKYEVVRDNSPIIEHSTDIKVDPFKAKVSAAVGIKVQVTKSVEASIAYKFKSDFDEMVELLRTDKRGFRYALLRNLDVVLGKNIKLTDKDGKPFSECLKTIGVGLVFDPDLCIFSILLPVTFPIGSGQVGDGKVKGRVTANMVLKFGPTKAMWAAMFRKFGGRTAMRWILEAMKSMTRQLPSEVAAAAEKASETAAKAIAGEVAAEGLLASIMSWVGVYTIAFPISMILTDFMLMVTRSARAAGVRDGDYNIWANTYMRTAYGLEIPWHADPRSGLVKRAAIAQAERDLKSYGTDSLHRYLEENFNNSRPVADGSGRVHGSREVTVMAERMWLQLRKQFN